MIGASLLLMLQRFMVLNYFNVSTALSMNVDDSTTITSSTTQKSATADLIAAAWDSMSHTIEELWLRETKHAENEIERQMLGLTGGSSMSMLIPQPAPVVAPKPITTMSPVDISSPTTAPTPDNCLNGRTSEQYLLDTLSSITTSVDILLNPATPQGRAFNFLLNDTLIEADDAICNYTTLQQRYGLGTLQR
jgi:hypothetical protein